MFQTGGAGKLHCQSTPVLLSGIYTWEEYIQDVSMIQMAEDVSPQL